MEQRRPSNKRILRIGWHIQHLRRGPRDFRPMADQGAFRQAGGAACVKNDDAVFGRGTFRHSATRIAHQSSNPNIIDHLNRRDIRQAFCLRLIARRGQQNSWFNQAQAMAQLVMRQTPILTGHDGANFSSRQKHFDIFNPVF